MSDLERVKQFYEWLGEDYGFDETEDLAVVEGVDCNQKITIGKRGDYYWTYYNFKDGKLVNWYTSE